MCCVLCPQMETVTVTRCMPCAGWLLAVEDWPDVLGKKFVEFSRMLSHLILLPIIGAVALPKPNGCHASRTPCAGVLWSWSMVVLSSLKVTGRESHGNDWSSDGPPAGPNSLEHRPGSEMLSVTQEVPGSKGLPSACSLRWLWRLPFCLVKCRMNSLRRVTPVMASTHPLFG